MSVTFSSLADLATHRFDDVIDVRAPSEFALDHLPGAINLPVLDDAERARVGTIYARDSPFAARKIGAALVARNAAHHIEMTLADRPGGWKPLVYCWRGGQRSGSFATILGQIGWQVETLAGGYKSWRKLVLTELTAQDVRAPVVILDGNTGSAKTEVLHLLAARGVPVIDLEGLANHRGSVFGEMGPQPAQTGFEGRLAMRLATLDPGRPVVVEAESSLIGERRLPPRLWAAMKAAPRLAIAAPAQARAGYLARAYADIGADPARLVAILDQLRPLQPAPRIDHWQALARSGDLGALAAGLIEHHYDPRYARHRARMAAPLTEIAAPDLSSAALPALADRVQAALSALTQGPP